MLLFKEISNLEAEECLKLAISIGVDLGVEVVVNVTDFRKEDRPEWSLIMKYILNLYYIISN